jgi:hypothetical protein
MRAREFVVEEEQSSTNNLISILSSLRAKTDQIRVDSLINMVRRQPGSEMFNIDLLMNAVKEDPVIQSLVSEIKSDDTGVKYAYLKPLSTDDDEAIQDIKTPDVATGGANNPEKTVATMAKRAALSRT